MKASSFVFGFSAFTTEQVWFRFGARHGGLQVLECQEPGCGRAGPARSFVFVPTGKGELHFCRWCGGKWRWAIPGERQFYARDIYRGVRIS